MIIFLQAEMYVNSANYMEEKYSSLWDLWVFYTLCCSIYLKIKAVYCFCIQKSRRWLRLETQIWSLGQEDPLEKGMVTHSSILVWKSELF